MHFIRILLFTYLQKAAALTVLVHHYITKYGSIFIVRSVVQYRWYHPTLAAKGHTLFH